MPETADWIQWGLIAACLLLIVLPPKYDPAIRLKEWVIKRSKENG